MNIIKKIVLTLEGMGINKQVICSELQINYSTLHRWMSTTKHKRIPSHHEGIKFILYCWSKGIHISLDMLYFELCSKPTLPKNLDSLYLQYKQQNCVIPKQIDQIVI